MARAVSPTNRRSRGGDSDLTPGHDDGRAITEHQAWRRWHRSVRRSPRTRPARAVSHRRCWSRTSTTARRRCDRSRCPRGTRRPGNRLARCSLPGRRTAWCLPHTGRCWSARYARRPVRCSSPTWSRRRRRSDTSRPRTWAHNQDRSDRRRVRLRLDLLCRSFSPARSRHRAARPASGSPSESERTRGPPGRAADRAP